MSDTTPLDVIPWRVGEHYGIHVYQGDRPVATFHTVADARQAVDAYNTLARNDVAALLDERNDELSIDVEVEP